MDLDLGCMIRCTDGSKTVVQALGNAFGAVDRFPYLALDADDRTGARETGENLVINLGHQAEFQELLLFVYVYQGSGDFRCLDAVVTLTSDRGARFRVLVDEFPPQAQACAITVIKREGRSRHRPGGPVVHPTGRPRCAGRDLPRVPARHEMTAGPEVASGQGDRASASPDTLDARPQNGPTAAWRAAAFRRNSTLVAGGSRPSAPLDRVGDACRYCRTH
ncbi:hypothetical protein [Streptomyces sp. C10-9-1]|uniref:hypothetical protein n=1 Tax=Streptomyces sp. C10-9-1 TaxID=1859285 RepID=UPI003D7589B6